MICWFLPFHTREVSMTVKVSKHGKLNNSTSCKKFVATKPSKSISSLVKLENVYKQTFDNSSDAIRVISKDFTVLRINKAFAEITDVDSDTVISKKCWDAFPSPLCHTQECRLQRILNGEKAIQVEIERKKKDGTTIPCIVTASPLLDGIGNLTGIIEQFQDITKIRHMEEHIQEAEEHNQALINLGSNVGEAIVMLQNIDGNEGVQTFVNDQWCKITGYTRDELIGKPLFDLIDPMDKKHFLEIYRAKMIGELIPQLSDIVILRKDRTPVSLEFTGVMTSSSGNPVYLMYLKDTSNIRRIEKAIEIEKDRHQSLFLNVPFAIWEIDYSGGKYIIDNLKANGISNIEEYIREHRELVSLFVCKQKFLASNRACLELFEADNPDEVTEFVTGINPSRDTDLNLDIFRIKHHYCSDVATDVIIKIMSGATSYSLDGEIETLKGNRKYVHCCTSVTIGHEKDLSRAYTSMIDITNQVQAEKALHDYKEHLEEIIKERTAQLKQEISWHTEAEKKIASLYKKEQKLNRKLQNNFKQRLSYTRMLVHELKTPLTPLLVSSNYLVETLTDERLSRFAQNIQMGANNLSKRINELLDIAKGDMGILSLHLKKTDPTTMLHSVYNYVLPEAKKNKLNLILDVHQQLPMIEIDQERIQQVIMNLLNNSFKFTRKDGNITISAITDKRYLIIEVEDTGCGIASKKQKQLFNLYHNRSKKEESLGGLGLGLTLSRMLVELHNGHISVISDEGRGSTFSFSIPYNIGDIKRKVIVR
jgi:PAS domain S-box-containing protein